MEQGGEGATGALGLEAVLRSEKNYAIYGKREFGKTSLAHFLAVRVTEGVSDRTRIPVVLDFRQIKLAPGALWRHVRSYFLKLTQPY